MSAKKDAVKKPAAKKPVAKKEVAKKNTSILVGFQISKFEKSQEDEGGILTVMDIVISADYKCHTIAEIKKVMVDEDIKGKVYIMREEPIERVVKEVVTFA